MIFDLLQSCSLTSLIIGGVFVLTLVYVFLLLPAHPADYPPMPQSPVPFFGHAYYFTSNPRKAMRRWRETNGNIFSIYIGNQLAIVLNGYDTIKEALVKHGDVFSARPVVYNVSCFRQPGGGVLQSSGENWKEQRTVSLSILRSFGMGKSILAEKVSEECASYNERLVALKGEPTNVKLLTNKCVSNVICNIMFGSRFDLDDPDFDYLINKLMRFVTLSLKTYLLTPYPWLNYLPGDLFKGREVAKIVADVEKILAEKYIEPLSQRDKLEEVDCFITEYMKEMIKKTDSGKPTTMSKKNLSSVIFDLFIAGTETTSTTTWWFILYMIHYPDVLKKIQDEIENVVGNERAPSMQDKSHLHYLNACIMETQRVISLVPNNLEHMCEETVTFNGYTIPKGAFVIPVLDSILHDEKIWPEPHTFRPERFLDDKGHLKTAEEHTPFSLGRRVCLGESLAKMELFLFWSNLCQRFDIRPAEEGKLPTLDYVNSIVAMPTPYEVRFIDRRK